MYKKIIFIVSFFLFVACTRQKPEIRVGFSHADLSGGWGVLMYQEILNEFSLYTDYDVRLTVKDARMSVQKQNQDIRDLYHEGIDVLIVYPIDSMSSVPVVEELFEKKLPVVVVDRELSTGKFNVFVGNNNIKIGREAGIYALNKLNQKGKILEVAGKEGATTAVDRSLGFHEAIKECKTVKITSIVDGGWLPEIAARKTDSILKAGFVPDLIYCHSDQMALGVQATCKKYRVRPIIIGVDGLPLKDTGLDMVLNKQLDATFYNDPGGGKIAQAAIDLFLRKQVPKYITLKTFPIDINNAGSIKVAYEIQAEQFDRIRKQQIQIRKMLGTIQYQHLVIYLSYAFIVLLVIIILAVTFFLKQKQKLISLIEEQKKKIEQQMSQEKVLAGQLMNSNRLLQEQREEILGKNKNLETYRNQLEQLVKERTRDLEIALEKVNESDRLKTSFLSNLSHEIRTPLNSIMGFVDLLLDPNAVQRDDRKFRSIINDSCNQLLKSITQIVEITKLTTEKIELVNTLIPVSQLFGELDKEIRLNHKELFSENTKNVDFKFIISNDLSIETDVFRVKQIFNCLIDNALKFTNTGYVHIGVEKSTGRFVRFYVKDSGIGIEKEYQEVIFDKFRKIEDNANVLYRGSGLGLAISKQIVELLGGSISLNSEIGKGSEFSFLIPCLVGDNIQEEQQKIASAPGLHPETINILVAEDEDVNFLYVETLLKKKFKNIQRAKNGLEAYNYCLDHQPDIILMDIKMPVLNGIEALKKIRLIYPEIPIMAITAHAFINEKEQILKEGFNNYLAKPFTSNNLFKMIEELVPC